MRRLILVLSIFLFIVSCNNKELKVIDGLAYLEDQKIPFTGIYSEYWSNGKLKSEIKYNNGVREGKYKYFFKTGEKWYEGSTKDGKESGLWTEWYKNGQYKEQGAFVKGLKNGFWIKWDGLGNEIDKKLYQTYEDSVGERAFLIHDLGYRNYVFGHDARKPETFIKFWDNRQVFTWFTFHIDYKNNIIKQVTKEERNGHTMMDIAYVKTFDEGESNLRDSLLSSIYLEYYGDRKFSKIRKITGKDGKRYETNTYFYRNGKKLLERTYIDFNKDGVWKWWNENGELIKTLNCKNDTIYDDGNNPLNDTLEYKYQYENLEFVRFTPFVDGVENGIEILYRDSVLAQTLEYKDGTYNGQNIVYYPDGKYMNTTDYVNDTIHGKTVSFFPSGDTNLVLDYVKGLKTGEGCYNYEAHGGLGGYFKNENDSVTRVTMLGWYGDVWQTFTKVNDLVEGEYLIYYAPKDSIRYRIHFEKGNKQGLCEQLYFNGNPMAVYNYWYDILDGKFELYHENGKIQVEGFWDNGAKSGTWKRFDENGNLIKEGEYADGLLIKGDTINTDYSFEIKNLTIF